MIDEKDVELELFELTSCADKLKIRISVSNIAISVMDNYSCKWSCSEVCALGSFLISCEDLNRQFALHFQ